MDDGQEAQAASVKHLPMNEIHASIAEQAKVNGNLRYTVSARAFRLERRSCAR
jgi:vacuolar-type H+-ATPase subunit B/Vma2